MATLRRPTGIRPGTVLRRFRGPVLGLSLALLGSACGPEAELEEPVPLFDDVPIEYPLSLWDQQVEGTTVLRVWVSQTGSVDSTRIVESSGHEAFDSAAVRGGRLLRFEPASREGEPVAVWAQVPVHFSLNENRLPGAEAGAAEVDAGAAGSAEGPATSGEASSGDAASGDVPPGDVPSDDPSSGGDS